MDDMVIRVSEEELSSRNQSSVKLPKGGHMAWLGVYHELHCVVSMLAPFVNFDIPGQWSFNGNFLENASRV